VKFLVDAQLPPALAAWFRNIGCDAVDVEDAGLRDADDEAISAYAAAKGYVLVTKDRDFVSAVHTTTEPRILWIRTGNVANRILYQRLDAGWLRILAHLESGVRLAELR
jgi:predicted nuclease of predicted toxin-antitoxin system